MPPRDCRCVTFAICCPCEPRACRSMSSPERINLLIIDDWGPDPPDAEQRRDLVEIVDDRYDNGSLLITSQVPIAQWH